MSVWIYFATTAKASKTDTLRLLVDSQFLWRSHRNSNGAAIANTANVQPGDFVLLCYERVPHAWLRVNPPPKRVPGFPAITQLDDPELIELLLDINYRPAHDGGWFGFDVEVLALDMTHALAGLPTLRIPGNNALHRAQNLLEQEQLQQLLALPELTPDQVLELASSPSSARSSSSRSAANHSTSTPTISHFAQQPTLRFPTQPELYLGVDVGFSSKHESLGYCMLRLEPSENGARISVSPRVANTVANAETAYLTQFTPKLAQFAATKPELCAVALDGPVTPHAKPHPNPPPYYRPCERSLLQGSIPVLLHSR
jgi:hypothetical protein